jgi:hypothetical protein
MWGLWWTKWHWGAISPSTFSFHILLHTHQHLLAGAGTRGSVVGMATDYGSGNLGVGVRVPVASRIVTSPYRVRRLWGLPRILSNGYRVSFPGVKLQGR